MGRSLSNHTLAFKSRGEHDGMRQSVQLYLLLPALTTLTRFKTALTRLHINRVARERTCLNAHSYENSCKHGGAMML